MQKRDRKRYSREFKLEALRQTQVTGKSVAEVVSVSGLTSEINVFVNYYSPNGGKGDSPLFSYR